eukprot:scaffold14380_cov35-Prasinocladus_malaysianus.AAC.1
MAVVHNNTYGQKGQDNHKGSAADSVPLKQLSFTDSSYLIIVFAQTNLQEMHTGRGENVADKAKEVEPNADFFSFEIA